MDENRINYKDLYQKIYFSKENSSRSHVIDFLKIFGTLCDLLDNLLTSKVTTDNANANQITFITKVMHGHDKSDLFDEKTRVSVK